MALEEEKAKFGNRWDEVQSNLKTGEVRWLRRRSDDGHFNRADWVKQTHRLYQLKDGFLCMGLLWNQIMCACSDIAPGKMFVQFFRVVKTLGESIAEVTRECSEDRLSFEESSLGAGWVSQASFTYAEAALFPNYTTAATAFLAFLLFWALRSKPHIKMCEKKGSQRLNLYYGWV